MVRLKCFGRPTQGLSQTVFEPLKSEHAHQLSPPPSSPKLFIDVDELEITLKIDLKVDAVEDELKPELEDDVPVRTRPIRRRLDCIEIPPMQPIWRRAWERALAREREQRGPERRLIHRTSLLSPPTSRSPSPKPGLAQPRKFVVIAGVRLPVSPMLDTMFYWIHERHELFLRRLQGQPPPWTDDVILRHHRFTNVSRTYDRATQFLIRNVINVGDQDHEELVFRTILFRLFNRISTYEYLQRHCGPLSVANFDIKKWSAALTRLQRTGARLYTGAYQVNWPNFGAETADKPSHEKHFILIKHMLRDGLPEKLRSYSRLKDAFNSIRLYPSCGQFISYQYVSNNRFDPLVA
jgi:hypothetical protein